MLMIALMGLSILIPLLVGLPIAVTLGAAGLIWIVLYDPGLVYGAAYSVWSTSTAEVLASIPLFLLMGEIIQRSNIAGKFYDATSLWLRNIPGGLLHSNIVACAVFSAVSGSSTATAATIGTTALPNLRRLNYGKKLTFGTIAAGGTLGILIPPSVPLIIYASMVEASIGRLFVAALIPGVLMAVIFMAYTLLASRISDQGLPKREKLTVSFSDRIQSIKAMIPLLMIIVIVLGGIYLGWTTAAEAAALGVLVSAGVAAVERRLNLKMMLESLRSSARFSAMIMFVIVGANIFSFAVFTWGFGRDIADFVASLPYHPAMIIAIISLIYLVIGMFVDPISIMVMTIPVIFPVVIGLGYDPIWFGIVLVLLLEVGLITPPVGMNLFAIQAIDPKNISLGEVAQGAFPFVLLLLLGVVLLVMYPSIALWLPKTMM